MRKRTPDRLEQGRCHIHDYVDYPPGNMNGFFMVQGPCGEVLKIIASTADVQPETVQGWEHVSVSTRRRPPNWQEMCFVKDLFFDPEETVVQLHPPKSKWISNHPNCLHMWRNVHFEIPLPPSIMVGVQEVGEIRDEAHAREVRDKYGT